jgi:hypothetical protein
MFACRRPVAGKESAVHECIAAGHPYNRRAFEMGVMSHTWTEPPNPLMRRVKLRGSNS